MKVVIKLSEKQLLQLIQNFVDEEAEFIAKLVRQELRRGYHDHRLHMVAP